MYTVPDIIMFTYYHCTSIDYGVLCEWSTQYYILQYMHKYTFTRTLQVDIHFFLKNIWFSIAAVIDLSFFLL